MRTRCKLRQEDIYARVELPYTVRCHFHDLFHPLECACVIIKTVLLANRALTSSPVKLGLAEIGDFGFNFLPRVAKVAPSRRLFARHLRSEKGWGKQGPLNGLEPSEKCLSSGVKHFPTKRDDVAGFGGRRQ